MPKKPIKEGFKVWCCCCSCCKYLWTFRLYEGKPVNPLTGKKQRETGLVQKVYMDNFFTGGPLVDELAKHDIFVAGTIQQTAQGFPERSKTPCRPICWGEHRRD